MFAQGVVVDPSAGSTPDGSLGTLNLGRSNEAIVAELHGKYYEQCYRGNLYYTTTTAAGVALITSSTLTPTYSLWNPAGSGKNAVLVSLMVAWGTVTTVAGGVVWTATTNAGSSISTTAPMVAFGTGSAINANLGSGKIAQLKCATGGTTTIVAAATLYRTTGIAVGSTSLVAGTAWWVAREEYDGSMIVPPGNAIHLMASTALAATCCITTAWYEAAL
jgi:hypothetical protein